MRRILLAAYMLFLVVRAGGLAVADDNKDASPVIDKAIKALGGEEKLKAAKTATWKGKGKVTVDGNQSTVLTNTTMQGLDYARQEFESDSQGNRVKGVSVLAGDQALLKYGDNVSDIEGERLEAEKQNIYLVAIGANILYLKDASIQIQSVGEEKVGDKSAVAIQATGPDDKYFLIFFDKETGLPLKLTATVVDRNGKEYEMESTYDEYSVFDGFKRPTKITVKEDGEVFVEQKISDFKVLDKVDESTFAEPQ